MNVTSLSPSRSEGSEERTSSRQPVLLGVAPVHLEEVLGEEVRLLAPFGAPDLDDDVATVVRDPWARSRRLQLLFELGGLGLATVRARRSQQLAVLADASVSIWRAVCDVLLGLAEPTAMVTSASRSLWRRDAPARRAWSRDDGRVGRALEDRLVLALPGGQAFGIHGTRVPTSLEPPAVRTSDRSAGQRARRSRPSARLALRLEPRCP